MADIIFWEKPGCKGNAKQKEVLLASGHTLKVRNLLTEAWTAELLARFFGDRPVAEWFNPTHPLVKAGEIDPEDISPQEALQMMVDEPLLIVRPLMQVVERRLAGFDVEQVHQWVGLNIWLGENLDLLAARDLQHCPCVVNG